MSEILSGGGKGVAAEKLVRLSREISGREEWVLIKCYVDVPKGGVECATGRNLMIPIARLDLRDRAKMMWGPHTINRAILFFILLKYFF